MTTISPFPHVAVLTHYVGPTNTKGGRVVATHMNNRTLKATVAWNHALGVGENHDAAVKALEDKCEALSRGQSYVWCRGSVDGGGFVYVRVSASDLATD